MRIDKIPPLGFGISLKAHHGRLLLAEGGRTAKTEAQFPRVHRAAARTGGAAVAVFAGHLPEIAQGLQRLVNLIFREPAMLPHLAGSFSGFLPESRNSRSDPNIDKRRR